jgi:hypothetical protein
MKVFRRDTGYIDYFSACIWRAFKYLGGKIRWRVRGHMKHF